MKDITSRPTLFSKMATTRYPWSLWQYLSSNSKTIEACESPAQVHKNTKIKMFQNGSVRCARCGLPSRAGGGKSRLVTRRPPGHGVAQAGFGLSGPPGQSSLRKISQPSRTFQLCHHYNEIAKFNKPPGHGVHKLVSVLVGHRGNRHFSIIPPLEILGPLRGPISG